MGLARAQADLAQTLVAIEQPMRRGPVHVTAAAADDAVHQRSHRFRRQRFKYKHEPVRALVDTATIER
jgi:hypothetical protein